MKGQQPPMRKCSRCGEYKESNKMRWKPSKMKTLYAMDLGRLRNRLRKLIEIWNSYPKERIELELGKTADMYLYKGGGPNFRRFKRFF